MAGAHRYRHQRNRGAPSIIAHLSKVKKAALWLAETEDAEFWLHPERLLKCMSGGRAEEWQNRLGKMDECHRAADRDVLLEDGVCPLSGRYYWRGPKPEGVAVWQPGRL